MEKQTNEPSQEAIIIAFTEMLLKFTSRSLESDLDYILKSEEKVILHYEFCGKDILNRAHFIEQNNLSNQVGEIGETLLKRIKHMIEVKLLNDKVSKDLNDIFNNQIINGVALTEKYIQENYQYSDLLITRLKMLDYKFGM